MDKKNICNKLREESTCDDCENCEVWAEQIEPTFNEIKADERTKVLESLYYDVLCLENEYWGMLAHTRVKSLEWFDINGKLVATTKIKYLIQDKSKGAEE